MTYVVKVEGLALSPIQAVVRELGYRPIGRIILRRVLGILINDIKLGRTGWPVDSGYSRRNFYTDGRRLLNYARYAPALESGNRRNNTKAKKYGFILRYWRQHRVRIIRLALRSLGWSKVGARTAPSFRTDVVSAHYTFLVRSRRGSVRPVATLSELLRPRGYVDPTPLLIRQTRQIERTGLRSRSGGRETRADRARAYRAYRKILRKLFN